ncbi:hypothetical protein [Pseudolysinimonas kribbensis]|nr:hypothetical protein [Pseudolysinimonas kribbensis]
MSKLIRRAYRAGIARDAVDQYLEAFVGRRIDTTAGAAWRGFELFVQGHADPTAAHALQSIAPGVRWSDDPYWADGRFNNDDN